eukprot:gene29549-5899_t
MPPETIWQGCQATTFSDLAGLMERQHSRSGQQLEGSPSVIKIITTIITITIAITVSKGALPAVLSPCQSGSPATWGPTSANNTGAFSPFKASNNNSTATNNNAYSSIGEGRVNCMPGPTKRRSQMGQPATDNPKIGVSETRGVTPGRIELLR